MKPGGGADVPLDIKKHEKEEKDKLKKRNPLLLQKNTTIHEIEFANALIGFILFISIVVILLPIVFCKLKYFSLLKAWMPNVDLIANVLTWWRGPFDIFGHLYLQLPTTFFSLASQTFINYLALLGLTYVIISKAVKHNNIYAGWGDAFVMLIVTYLVPSRIVIEIMRKLHIFIKPTFIVSVLGMVSTVLIIFLEMYLLDNYGPFLRKYSRHVLSVTKHI